MTQHKSAPMIALLAAIAPLEAEQIPVDESGGRYLREALVARALEAVVPDHISLDEISSKVS